MSARLRAASVSLLMVAATLTPALAAETVNFSYADNTSVVPKEPLRVVTIQGRTDLEFALIAGWNVVASGNFVAGQDRPGEQFPDLMAADMPMLAVDVTKINFEQLIAFEPDLIIMGSYGYQTDWYDNARLSQIAPILPVSDGHDGWKTDLVAQLTQFGLADKAEALIVKYDARIAEIKTEIDPLVAGKKVGIVVTSEDSVLVQHSNLQMVTAHDLGLDLPFWDPALDSGTEFAQESYGELALFDLIMRQNQGSVDSGPLWDRLPAVAAGHVYEVDQRDNQGYGLAGLNFAEKLREAAYLLQ
ncbi:ABC transporter substrate-binding protein [Devosia sp. 2618]|uniref:ABC transporter substrate-binding protein n=1 Tax=Devosia sp. 2618 TaxID=3156454 RepID=UPI0033999C93